MRQLDISGAKEGFLGLVVSCQDPADMDVYRLLELGLYEGVKFLVLRNIKALKTIEIGINENRLAISYALAQKFIVKSI